MNVIQIICCSKVFSRIIYDFEIKFITRLHSSRMRTARALTVSPSMHLRGTSALGGGGLLPGGGRGGACSRVVSAQGAAQGVSAWGVSALGGVCSGGVSQHPLRRTPPL